MGERQRCSTTLSRYGTGSSWSITTRVRVWRLRRSDHRGAQASVPLPPPRTILARSASIDAYAKEALEDSKESIKHAVESIAHAEMEGEKSEEKK